VLASLEDGADAGRRVLEAMIVGYDVALRVLEAAGGYRAHNGQGWHSTGTCGSFGAAAAAARALGLDAERTAWALGLAGSFTGGTWAFLDDGSMSKRYHPGRAAETGVLAAALARAGFTGPTRVFEAEWGGFLKTYAAGRARPAALTDALVPAIRKGGKLTPTAVNNQLTVMKAIGAIEAAPDSSEGVLWTNAYNK